MIELFAHELIISIFNVNYHTMGVHSKRYALPSVSAVQQPFFISINIFIIS